MCTLIIGRDLPWPGHVLLSANRDEDPARPSEPPRMLGEAPRLVGGRDLVAGGTWLAVRAPEPPGGATALELAGHRGAPAAVMLLNRPSHPGRPPGRRSRGVWVLDVAAAAYPLLAAREAAASGDYGPCTLVFD